MAAGWGCFSQRYDAKSFSAAIELREGKLRLEDALAAPAAGPQGQGFESDRGRQSEAEPVFNGWRTVRSFNSPELLLGSSQALTIQTR